MFTHGAETFHNVKFTLCSKIAKFCNTAITLVMLIVIWYTQSIYFYSLNPCVKHRGAIWANRERQSLNGVSQP